MSRPPDPTPPGASNPAPLFLGQPLPGSHAAGPNPLPPGVTPPKGYGPLAIPPPAAPPDMDAAFSRWNQGYCAIPPDERSARLTYLLQPFEQYSLLHHAETHLTTLIAVAAERMIAEGYWRESQITGRAHRRPTAFAVDLFKLYGCERSRDRLYHLRPAARRYLELEARTIARPRSLGALEPWPKKGWLEHYLTLLKKLGHPPTETEARDYVQTLPGRRQTLSGPQAVLARLQSIIQGVLPRATQSSDPLFAVALQELAAVLTAALQDKPGPVLEAVARPETLPAYTGQTCPFALTVVPGASRQELVVTVELEHFPDPWPKILARTRPGRAGWLPEDAGPNQLQFRRSLSTNPHEAHAQTREAVRWIVRRSFAALTPLPSVWPVLAPAAAEKS